MDPHRRETKKMSLEEINRLRRRDTKVMPAQQLGELLAEMAVEGEVDEARKNREG
jgi:hypothetical protein